MDYIKRWIPIAALSFMLGSCSTVAQESRSVVALESQSADKCKPRAEVLRIAADMWGEYPKIWGVSKTGNLVEWFANPETGSWTIFVTSANGLTCVFGWGEGFTILDPALKGIVS